MIRSIFKRQIDQKFKIPQFLLNKSRKERITRNILNKIMNLINQDVELIFNQFIIEICMVNSEDFKFRVFSREILNTTLQIPNNLFTFTSTNYLYTYLYHIINKYGFPEMIFSSYISIIEENQDLNFDVNIDFSLDFSLDVDTPHPILMSERKNFCFLLNSFDENNNELFLYLDKFICDE